MPWPRRLMPSVQELSAFEAAARHGNFSRAADELALTQSAISKQVSHLEARLGVTLFEREGRRVILTDQGRDFREAARDLLDRFATATLAVMASAGSESTLNVAVLPTLAAKWLMPRLPRFHEENAQISLNFTTRLEPFDFAGTSFHAALHYGEPYWPGAETVHLFDEIVVPVASRGYRERLRLREPDDLKRADLLHLSTRPHLWSAWFEMTGVRCDYPLRGAVFDQFSHTAAAAVAGLGVALLPRFLIDDEIVAGKLLILFDRSMPGQGAYYGVVPKNKRSEPAVAKFMAWIKREAERSNMTGVCDAESPALSALTFERVSFA
ncbi:MAG: LysR family transcriptional regulator [Hyphomicrobiales bacterium]|nr:LysR family transcriptional regulator [Hyphomicrobiales bacterium]MBV8824265.1 LysR family transcriptional regulator [Hyphomicrobiales bacterium]MBV9428579.1 LysR family transcriptional regulator [Bradyrhizobiaceae bacterium]